MAEYVEVQKQFARMCESGNCSKCSIGADRPGKPDVNCYNMMREEPAKAEKLIMAWAAAHPEKPEPVYPTWEDEFSEVYASTGQVHTITIVFKDNSLVRLGPYGVTFFADEDKSFHYSFFDQIIPTLAEKLGIKPLNADPIDDNPALTVDELMGMDGEKVWVVDVEQPLPVRPEWHFVDVDGKRLRDENGMHWNFSGVEQGDRKVYRRKPDGEGAK